MGKDKKGAKDMMCRVGKDTFTGEFKTITSDAMTVNKIQIFIQEEIVDITEALFKSLPKERRIELKAEKEFAFRILEYIITEKQ